MGIKLLAVAPDYGMLPVGICYISAVLKKTGYLVVCYKTCAFIFYARVQRDLSALFPPETRA